MFDKKNDSSNSTKTDVFRPAKGSAKVVIGNGVSITGEIKKADEVQIDGEADVTMKTDNLVVGSTGHCKGNVETHNADVWGTFDGDINASGTLTIQEEGKVSGTSANTENGICQRFTGNQQRIAQINSYDYTLLHYATQAGF